MVFHGSFATSGDDDEFANAGIIRLFNGILDDRLVDDGEHLLGHGLGGG